MSAIFLKNHKRRQQTFCFPDANLIVGINFFVYFLVNREKLHLAVKISKIQNLIFLSALSFSLFGKQLRNFVNCYVIAPDIRGHGLSNCQDETNLRGWSPLFELEI